MIESLTLLLCITLALAIDYALTKEAPVTAGISFVILLTLLGVVYAG